MEFILRFFLFLVLFNSAQAAQENKCDIQLISPSAKAMVERANFGSPLDLLDALGTPSVIIDTNLGIIEWQTFNANGVLRSQFKESHQSRSWAPEAILKWVREEIKNPLPGYGPSRAKFGTTDLNITAEIKSRSTDGKALVSLKLFDVEVVLEILQARFQLTPREAEILHWITNGKTTPDIGAILETSPRTVQKHIEHIFQKMNVETRTAATRLALEAVNEGIFYKSKKYTFSRILMDMPLAKVRAEILQQKLALNPNEAEVLYWLLVGKTSSEVVTILESTAVVLRKHIDSINVKLKVKEISEAVKIAKSIMPQDGSPQAAQPTSDEQKSHQDNTPTAVPAGKSYTTSTLENPRIIPEIKMLETKFNLPPRKAEVFYWLAQGKTKTEISAILKLSYSTIEISIADIYKKLGVKTKESATLLASEVLSNGASLVKSTDFSETIKANPQTKKAAELLQEHFKILKQEAELLFWIVAGKSNSEIALIFEIHPKLAQQNISDLYKKLDISNRTTAINLAMKALPHEIIAEYTKFKYSPLLMSDESKKAQAYSIEVKLKLTPDEAELLFWIANKRTSQEISQILQTTLWTVNGRIENLYKKIQVKSRAEAEQLAMSALPETEATQIKTNQIHPSIRQNSSGLKVVVLLEKTIGLSSSESEILFLILKGQSAAEISELFEISERTLEDRLKILFQKTGTTTRAELIESVIDKLPAPLPSQFIQYHLSKTTNKTKDAITTVMSLRSQLKLTIQHAEILYWLGKNLAIHEVADTLNISRSGLSKILPKLYETLKVSTREEAMQSVFNLFPELKLMVELEQLSSTIKQDTAAVARTKKIQKTFGLILSDAEIAYWVAMGKTNPEISTITGIQIRMVAEKLKEIFKTMAVNDRLELAQKLFESIPELKPQVESTQDSFSTSVTGKTEIKIAADAIMKKFGLTNEMAEILYWIAVGKSNSEIAEFRNLDPKSSTDKMKRKVSQLLAILKVENRLDAAKKVQDLIPKKDLNPLVSKPEYSATLNLDSAAKKWVLYLQEKYGLSAEDAEILYWATTGKSSPKIGEIMGRSFSAIYSRLDKIAEKLNVANRTEAIQLIQKNDFKKRP